MLITESHNFIKQSETKEVVVSLRHDGILHVYIKPGAEINVDAHNRMNEAINELTDSPRPFVFESGEFSSVTKEARTKAKSEEATSMATATAIVVVNLGQRILADYYYKINKPTIPIKIFKNLDQATKWLTEYHMAKDQSA